MIATSDTVLLSWFFSGSIVDALSIAFLELVTKTVLYYVHERMWAHLVQLWRKKNQSRVRQSTSIAKALTWRLFASLDTMLLAFIITGDITVAVSIGGVEVFTKLILYYGHERAWSRVRWGRV